MTVRRVWAREFPSMRGDIDLPHSDFPSGLPAIDCSGLGRRILPGPGTVRPNQVSVGDPDHDWLCQSWQQEGGWLC